MIRYWEYQPAVANMAPIGRSCGSYYHEPATSLNLSSTIVMQLQQAHKSTLPLIYEKHIVRHMDIDNSPWRWCWTAAVTFISALPESIVSAAN